MIFKDIKQYIITEKQKIKEELLKNPQEKSFVIIQVNNNPASDSYIRGKLKDSAEVGIKARLIKLDPNTAQKELVQLINQLNEDDSVGGLIVQMPLPKHINEETIKLTIDPKKDVDGFHPLSECMPCTPKGIIDYLKDNNFIFTGKTALIIGRSNIVGKPMAKLLLKENMNTIIVHSKTSNADMRNFLKIADLVIVAIGKAHFINFNEYKTDAVLIDVGINRVETGLVGDIAPNQVVLYQSPVPGGVGLLTRLTLLKNFLSLTNK